MPLSFALAELEVDSLEVVTDLSPAEVNLKQIVTGNENAAIGIETALPIAGFCECECDNGAGCCCSCGGCC